MENFDEVTNIISGKDLDYLYYMFNWNYGAYKSSYNSLECIEDEEVKKQVSLVADLFYNNMEEILDILKGGLNE